jgi:hypothetical protein
LFNPIKQFERLGVGRVEKAVNWRISKMNQVYAHSATYPSIIAVPATVTDDDLVFVLMSRISLLPFLMISFVRFTPVLSSNTGPKEEFQL